MSGSWIAGCARNAGIATMAFYGVLVLFQLVRYFRTAAGLNALGGMDLHMPRKREDAAGKLPWTELLAAFALSRLAVLAISFAFAALTGDLPGFVTNFWSYWCKWDGNHYVGLMENWYVTEGDARLHLVFFPLYPLIGRALYLLGLPSEAAALLISNGALIGAGWAMARLAEMTYGTKTARRALWLMMFCPVTFFFSMPYTESLFLFVTLAAVLMARRRHYAAAVFFGALAANTRMVGMAVAIPIFWEMLSDAWASYSAGRGGDARRRDGAFLRKAALCVLRVLPVLLGFAAYLALNDRLHGNPFQFLIYQKENWSQEMGSLARTIDYTLNNALSYQKWTYRYGTWIPQIVTIFATILLMTKQWRRQHPGDAAYALVYFYLSVAPTWLLSGARYVAAMYALYPMLAVMLKGRRRFAAAMAVEGVLLVYMTVMGVNIGYVL